MSRGSRASAFGFLLRHIGSQRVPLVLAVLLVMGGSVAGIFQPLIMGEVFGRLERGEDTGPAVVILAVVLVVGIVVGLAGSIALMRVTEHVIGNVRTEVVGRLMQGGVEAVTLRNPADLVSRATSDASMIRMAVSMGVVSALTSLITVVGSIVMMAALNSFLLGVTFAAVLVPLSILVVSLPRVRVWSRHTQDKLSEFAQSLDRSLQGFETVVALDVRETHASRLEERIVKTRSAGTRAAVWRAVNSSVSQVTIQFSYIVTLMAGAMQVSNGDFTLSGLMTFLMYSMQMTAPVFTLVTAATGLQTAAGSIERIQEAERIPADVVQPLPSSTAVAPVQGGGPRLDDVSFRYHGQGEPLLSGVDLTVAPRGLTVIVGPSGHGKSTVARLMAGLLQATEGSVAVSGRDVRQWDRAELRREVGFSDQHGTLFEGTVRDNLLHGLDTVVSDATLRAMMADLGLGHEVGLDDDVGVQGRGLSGGQRSRIALARTLLRNPRVLVLDEPTAALDRASEDLVVARLRELAASRPVVVVAHRRAAVAAADTVVVVRDGAISAQGPLTDLAENQDVRRVMEEGRTT